MSEQAILVASFGTTHDDTRKNCIEALEDLTAQMHPDCLHGRAFTSGMVRRALEKRGVAVPSPAGALGALAAQGARQVWVLPSHVIAGHELDKLVAACHSARGAFEALAVARPLLCGDEDIGEVLGIVLEEVRPAQGEGLVLMGHGTDHAAGAIYGRMNEYIDANGLGDVYVATVEGEPGLGDALADMKTRGVARVVLAPLMFVAGDHAKNDMAGEGGSWRAAFEVAGFAVRTVLRGLGEYEGIRRLYMRRLAEILPD